MAAELHTFADAVEQLVDDAQDKITRGKDLSITFAGAGTQTIAHGLGRKHRNIIMGVPRAAASVTVFEPNSAHGQEETHIRLTASGACVLTVRVY